MGDTGHITRANMPGGALADLLLFDPADTPTYFIDIDGLVPGATIKRRQIAESGYADDAWQVQSSKARIPATWSFTVVGTDNADLLTKITTLVEAVDLQKSWELHVLLGGVAEYAWSCWDAEVTVGFPAPHHLGLWAPVTVATPRSPTPVAGPI